MLFGVSQSRCVSEELVSGVARLPDLAGLWNHTCMLVLIFIVKCFVVAGAFFTLKC